MVTSYPIRPSAALRLAGLAPGHTPPADAPKPSPVAGNVVRLVARIDGGEPRTFGGRVAQTLHRLAVVGDRGLSSIENIGPRLSHYIFVLRRAGVGIVTIDEKHGGPYAGEHGRYRLTVPVEILGTETKP